MRKSVLITPALLSGTLKIMPSKSVSHRATICAALAGGSVVDNIGLSEDIRATVGALAALGFGCELDGNSLRSNGKAGPAKAAEIDCGESGSTLRLLLPLALDGGSARFTGRGRLLERPMAPYAEMFQKRGIYMEHTPRYIDVRGKLESGVFSLRGDVSSQFVSGLMFALPRLAGDSLIELSSPLESRSYVLLTMQALKAFGVTITETRRDGLEAYEIPGGQAFKPAHVRVEGDYSHAAFWLVAGALGGGARLQGLDKNSVQGDAAVIDILRKMNADIELEGGELTVRPSRLKGTDVDISQTPDIFPILAVAACAAEGETRLYGGARLRVKESDRLSAMATELAKLGANVSEGGDALRVRGGRLRGGDVSAHADHRIAMSLAVAASICEDSVRIDDAWCVSKSAPDFWREYASAGGKYQLEGERD